VPLFARHEGRNAVCVRLATTSTDMVSGWRGRPARLLARMPAGSRWRKGEFVPRSSLPLDTRARARARGQKAQQ